MEQGEIRQMMCKTDVIKSLKICRATLERMIKDGEFPAPDLYVGLGSSRRAARWRPETFEAWINRNAGKRRCGGS